MMKGESSTTENVEFEKCLVEYIRDKDRKKRGVLFAGLIKGSDVVAVGCSLCNKIDKFDYIGGKKAKGFGLKLAKLRASKLIEKKDVHIPDSVAQNHLPQFLDRCKRYYKKQVNSVIESKEK